MRLSRPPCRYLVVVLVSLALSACSARRAPVPETRSDLDALKYGEAPSLRGPVRPVVAEVPMVIPAGPPAVLPQAYTVDAGDKLRIVVFGQEGLSNSYLVDPQGQIMMPLIGGVKARGLTTKELAGVVAGRLRSQGFLREPQVAIEIEVFRPFFILGEVSFPGQYPYVAEMNVEKAIAIAGGFSPRAFKGSVEIQRPIGGEIVRIPAALMDPVRPGDSITVTERWF